MRSQWIEIDEEVLAQIKRKAEPFVDSPNDVLRSVFGLEPRDRPSCAPMPSDEAQSWGRGGRSLPGELLPLEEYEAPLLQALLRLGGSAPKQRVVSEVERDLRDRLTDLERQSLGSGQIRWENRLGFARLKAIDRGYIRRDSRRGIWELTEAGRGRAEAAAPPTGGEDG